MYRRDNRGFTLIEIMVTIAIIGILAAIAYPSYQDSVTRSRRADAQGALMGFANAMERYFSENNTYVGSEAGGPPGSPAGTVFKSTVPLDGGTTTYNLTIQANGISTYTLRATPTGPQDGDGFLEINQAGQKSWDRNNDGAIGGDETDWSR